MNYFSPFQEVKEKLDDLIAEHHLVATWKMLDYPLRLIVYPNSSPEAQMTLLESSERTASSNARLCYTFDLNQINVAIEGKLNLPDSLMNSIKTYAKKMHYLWLQGYFAALKEENGATDSGESELEKSAEDAPSDVDFEGFYNTDNPPNGVE
ncbi:MAG: hypothetical protein RSA62_05610 [Oscillospiraceae bacterium]